MPHFLATTVENAELSSAIVNTSPTIRNSFNEDQISHQPQDVQATLHYLSPYPAYTKSSPPIQVVTRASTFPDPRTTVKLSQGPPETIHDVRGRASEFSLEKNGFCFMKHASNVGEWECRDKIWTEYVERECRDIVREAFGGKEGGVDEVIAFHEGKRGSNKEWKQSSDGQRTNPFARQVHVDQTERTIHSIIKDKTDIKANWLMKGRVRQVNIWRPLYHPVYDCGLCVADAQSVRDDDLIECRRIRESDGEFLDTMGTIKYREGREWWYMSEMRPDDVVLFMGYDSDCSKGKREGTGFTLHSAFDIPNPPPGSPPRSSIEVRLLVFTWPKEPLSIHPPLGMLTAQTPPRNEEVYASHHTLNAEIEDQSPRGQQATTMREYPAHILPTPDSRGKIVEIDLNEYDPAETSRFQFYRNSFSHRSRPSFSLSDPESPSTSPSSLPQSWLSNHVLSAYASNITEQELLYSVAKRTESLRRQYEASMKVEEQMKSDRAMKTRILGILNERRRDELRRERRAMAERIRNSVTMDDFDL